MGEKNNIFGQFSPFNPLNMPLLVRRKFGINYVLTNTVPPNHITVCPRSLDPFYIVTCYIIGSRLLGHTVKKTFNITIPEAVKSAVDFCEGGNESGLLRLYLLIVLNHSKIKYVFFCIFLSRFDNGFYIRWHLIYKCALKE